LLGTTFRLQWLALVQLPLPPVQVLVFSAAWAASVKRRRKAQVG
jgi:hypothetical protein